MTPDYRELINRELERLHGLIEQGKEVAWAAKEIERINTLVLSCPSLFMNDSSRSAASPHTDRTQI